MEGDQHHVSADFSQVETYLQVISNLLQNITVCLH